MTYRSRGSFEFLVTVAFTMGSHESKWPLLKVQGRSRPSLVDPTGSLDLLLVLEYFHYESFPIEVERPETTALAPSPKDKLR